MSKKILVDSDLLQKIAEFVPVVMKELNNLRGQVSYHLNKQAENNLTLQEYQKEVIKAANAVYDSDLEFVTGDFDHRKFIKRAMEDPSYLARTLVKVCNAADVSLIGKPVRIATEKQAAINDPVYIRAFGNSRKNDDYLIDLDD